jgi:hypothetical protein
LRVAQHRHEDLSALRSWHRKAMCCRQSGDQSGFVEGHKSQQVAFRSGTAASSVAKILRGVRNANRCQCAASLATGKARANSRTRSALTAIDAAFIMVSTVLFLAAWDDWTSKPFRKFGFYDEAKLQSPPLPQCVRTRGREDSHCAHRSWSASCLRRVSESSGVTAARARLPASISAFSTHSLSVWPVPPIFVAVEVIAASWRFEQN